MSYVSNENLGYLKINVVNECMLFCHEKVNINDSFMRTTIHKTLWIDQLIYFADSDTVSFPEKAFPMAITHVVVSWKTQIIKNLERN